MADLAVMFVKLTFTCHLSLAGCHTESDCHTVALSHGTPFDVTERVKHLKKSTLGARGIPVRKTVMSTRHP